MSKIKVLQSLIAHPKEIITLGYQSMMRKKAQINYADRIQEKYGIAQLPMIDLLDLLPGFEEQTNYYSFLTDTSLITDILMLKALARKFRDCAYLEIGALRGESLACVADVAKECVAITLSEQEMRDMNFHPGYIRLHGVFSDDKPNVTTHRHNSLTFDFAKLDKKFDLIFVDGDHSYNGVLVDTKNVFKLLKDEHSMIVWHDYGFDVEQVRYEVMQAILDGTPEQYRKNLYHVSNTMCAIFTRDKYPVKVNERLSFPNKIFQVSVKANKL